LSSALDEDQLSHEVLALILAASYGAENFPARMRPLSLSFPVPDLPPGLDEVRGEVRAFLARARDAGHFRPRVNSWLAYDPAFSKLCGEAGWIGMTWPKAYGGQERSALERYVVTEEMLAAGAPVGAHWIADRQSGPQIIRHGTDEVREEILPGIVKGEIYFGIGMSEPNAGSDLAAVASTATKVDGGWKLNGRKIWTTNGWRVQYVIGLFRTAPRDDKARHAGLTQFVIDLRLPGIERRPIEDLTGAKDFSEMTFDDVFIPESHVLGQPGQGWELVTGELAFERSGPERFLSVFPALAAATSVTGGERSDAREIGRLVAHIGALRAMSLSVAGELQAGRLPNVEAALVKDLGNAHEQETPEVLRKLSSGGPMLGDGCYEEILAQAMMAAPSFSLRGGTPEVLRGIIARGLGLR
jgi:acyl-CoA dehydrogenase